MLQKMAGHFCLTNSMIKGHNFCLTECPVALDTAGISGIIIAITVLIGLLSLLIWKLITMFNDAREYAKFKKESENAGQDRVSSILI